jgi:hypothetical protein
MSKLRRDAWRRTLASRKGRDNTCEIWEAP